MGLPVVRPAGVGGAAWVAASASGPGSGLASGSGASVAASSSGASPGGGCSVVSAWSVTGR